MQQSTKERKQEIEDRALTALPIWQFLQWDDLVHGGMSEAAAYQKVAGRPFPSVNSTAETFGRIADRVIRQAFPPRHTNTFAPSGAPLAYGGCTCECHQHNTPPAKHVCCQTFDGPATGEHPWGDNAWSDR